MTEQVAVVAKLTAADGKADELAQAITDLVGAVAAAESQTLVYAAAADTEESGVFWFYEFYDSPDAAAAHASGSALAEASRRMRGLLAGRPEVHRLTPLAGKGLPG